MKLVKLKHQDKLIAEKLRLSQSYLENLMGYMFQAKPSADFDGWIFKTNSIHTCFMRFNLDVLFLNEKGIVIKKITSMKPWRFSSINLKIKFIIEMPVNTLAQNIQVGDVLEMINV